MILSVDVASGVNVSERVIANVGVAVQALGLARSGDDGVRAEEPAQGGVVEPRAVVIQALLYSIVLSLRCPVKR